MNTINLVQTEARNYVSSKLDGHVAKRLLEEPHLFRECIASYVGKIVYPVWLGGVTEILHINKTTLGISYNPDDLHNSVYLSIHGLNKDILHTKRLLEHILKIGLVRSN